MYITLVKYIVEFIRFMYFREWGFNIKYSVDVFDDQMYGLFLQSLIKYLDFLIQ